MSADPGPRGRVALVLPAKNEAASILQTLDALPLDTLRRLGVSSEVYVLDGHSEDATEAIARRWGAHVIHDGAPGKGNAVRSALPRIRGDALVMLDADGTYATDAIPAVLGPILRRDAEAAMGVRVPQPGSMRFINRVGNGLLTGFATLLYQRPCPDVCTGLWAFRLDALRALPLQSGGFGLESELFALSTRARYRIAKVPVDYLPRGGATKLHPGRDGLRIFRRLMRSRLSPLPALPGPQVPTAAARPEARA